MILPSLARFAKRGGCSSLGAGIVRPPRVEFPRPHESSSPAIPRSRHPRRHIHGRRHTVTAPVTRPEELFLRSPSGRRDGTRGRLVPLLQHGGLLKVLHGLDDVLLGLWHLADVSRVQEEERPLAVGVDDVLMFLLLLGRLVLGIPLAPDGPGTIAQCERLFSADSRLLRPGTALGHRDEKVVSQSCLPIATLLPHCLHLLPRPLLHHKVVLDPWFGGPGECPQLV
mmetsp:Transcript_8486/g.20881  ORF Transcript_8486/g.20881 Transcript_8486/m.20881 type:complete len:226 (+) Transcript_8486:369-1046(+)